MVQGLPWILIWKNWPNIRFSNRAGLALSYHNLRVGGSNPAPATIPFNNSADMAFWWLENRCQIDTKVQLFFHGKTCIGV
jgi:hypothetical protein